MGHSVGDVINIMLAIFTLPEPISGTHFWYSGWFNLGALVNFFLFHFDVKWKPWTSGPANECASDWATKAPNYLT